MRVYDAYRNAEAVVTSIHFVCGVLEYTVKLDEYDDTVFANSITDVSILKYEYDTTDNGLRLTLYVEQEVFDDIVSKYNNRKKTKLPETKTPPNSPKASNEPVFEEVKEPEPEEPVKEERIYKFTEEELAEIIEYKVKEKVKDVFSQLLYIVQQL